MLSTMAGSASATGGGSASSPQDENFVRRLIEAVKGQPCLYNPNHEHYGNKHSSAQYRCRVWQKLCVDLGFTGISLLIDCVVRYCSIDESMFYEIKIELCLCIIERMCQTMTHEGTAM